MKQQEEGGKKIKSFAQQSYIVTLLNRLFPPQSYSRMSEFTLASKDQKMRDKWMLPTGLYTCRVLPFLAIRPTLKNTTALHIFA